MKIIGKVIPPHKENAILRENTRLLQQYKEEAKKEQRSYEEIRAELMAALEEEESES